jgi:hypothetical protein
VSGKLDHLLPDIIQVAMIDLDLGTDPAPVPLPDSWPIYCGQNSMPASPDNVISVTRTASQLDGRTHRQGEVQEFYGVIIMVRGINDVVGYARAEMIREALDSQDTMYRRNVSLEGKVYRIHSMNRAGGLIHLGKEENGRRNLFSINYLTTVRQLS